MTFAPRMLGCLFALLLAGCGARTSVQVPGPGGVAGDDGGPAGPGDSGATTESGAPCGDGGPSEVSYVLDGSGVLYRYEVSTGQATPLGTPDCGDSNVQWTMTASRDTAYILYTDGPLYAVDLATLACSPTPFQPGQLGLDYDYGIAVTGSGGAGRLYVYGVPTGAANPILAAGDLQSFVLTKVGDVLPAPPPSTYPVNLTADGAGHLYAFSPGGFVQQVNPSTGAVLQSAQTGVTTTGTWATLAYGKDLHLWVGSNVVGYNLSTRTQTSLVDAGVFAIGGSSVAGCPGE